MIEEAEGAIHSISCNTPIPISFQICKYGFISIALGENIKPEPLTNDIFCEELSHPHLIATGKSGFQLKKKVQLAPFKYFNQWLLNYTQICLSDSDYIFFAHSIMQRFNLSNQINITTRKVISNRLIADMLRSNFNEKAKKFIVSDEAFTFMSITNLAK